MADLAVDVVRVRAEEEFAAGGCEQRARVLAMRLRARLAESDPVAAAIEAGARRAGELPEQTLAWLRWYTSQPVFSAGYEERLARATGPDPFGLLELPPPPPFLAGLDTTALPPQHIAPFLRRISMTRPAPAPEDLTPQALATDPGPLAHCHRTPEQRQWEQPPGAPLLPPDTLIPHIVHAIWLGGPVTPRAAIHANLAAAARRHQGHADFALWTDIPRTALHAADTAPPPPPGHPDPHKPLRDMLTWARDNGIHLISIHEVFNHDHPMNLHHQYTAETSKQLPRGYAAASDSLRLDIIYRLGGLYTDGDNHIGTTPDGTPLPATIPRTLTTTATSPHAFTLNVHAGGVNNDIIVAPAGHPAVLLWLELFRTSYLLTQAELFGGLEQMNRWFIGAPAERRWLRYTVPFRTGRTMCELFSRLSMALNDPRLVRPGMLIGTENELTWSREKYPAFPVPPGPDEVTTILTRATTTLLRQLITRDGNLRLTAIDPVINALPDPAAAWTATLTLTAELTTTPATSITQFRYTDNGTPHHVHLPPEAENLLNRNPPPRPWLGHTHAAPGHPAWLLDETTTPAELTTTPQSTGSVGNLKAITRVITGPGGRTTGLVIPADPGQPPLTPPDPVEGRSTILFSAPNGYPVADGQVITPETLARLIRRFGLHDRPLLLAAPVHDPDALVPLAEMLADLLGQPVQTTRAPFS